MQVSIYRYNPDQEAPPSMQTLSVDLPEGKAREQLQCLARNTGGRYIEVEIDRVRAARYGLNIADVQQVIAELPARAGQHGALLMTLEGVIVILFVIVTSYIYFFLF